MAEDLLLSLDEAMNELQIDQEQIKELIRKNALRYTLVEGRIKIPKMALMALKIERMTSNTAQFEQVPRATRRRKVNPGDKGPSENYVPMEEAMNLLQIDRPTLDKFIANKRLRTLEAEGSLHIPLISIQALRIQIPRPMGQSKKSEKRRAPVRRKY